MATKAPTRIHHQATGRYYLRAHFQASGLSREQLAGRMGMAPQSVSRLMTKADTKHKISGPRLQQFADILGVSMDDLRHPPRPKKDQSKARSADEMIKDDPADVQDLIFKMIDLIKSGRKSA